LAWDVRPVTPNHRKPRAAGPAGGTADTPGGIDNGNRRKLAAELYLAFSRSYARVRPLLTDDILTTAEVTHLLDIVEAAAQ